MAKEDNVVINKELKNGTYQDVNWCVTTLSSLLNDPSTHDVTFKTSDGGSVSGHRAIVAASSPVFHAMLYGNMKESNEKEITLPSVDTKTFKALLSFAYTGKIEMNTENCLGILEASHYFNVAMLENKCTDFIVSSLNIENCCTIASFAYSKMFDALVERCLAFMYLNAYKIIEEASFKSLPSDLLLKFCESSDLRVREIQLFLAVVDWGLHQKANITDDIIKKVLQQIRYPLISASDLLEKVHPTKLADLILYTAALDFHHMPSKYDGPKTQLVRRKSHNNFNVVNLTSGTIAVNENGPLVSITRKSNLNKWDGLCAVQMSLTEQLPIDFKVILEQSNGDHSGIHIVVRSCLESNLSTGSCLDGVDVNGFTIGEEVDGMITMEGGEIKTTIGHKTMTTTKQQDMIYLCVYLYYCNNSVSFFIY